MPKFNFHIGVTLRCYGNVKIEADSIEAALPLLTADFIGENIEIMETTTDSGQDLAVIDVSDEAGNDLGDWNGHHLPSPYDPTPVHTALIAALAKLDYVAAAAKRTLECADDKGISESNQITEPRPRLAKHRR